MLLSVLNGEPLNVNNMNNWCIHVTLKKRDRGLQHIL